MADEIVLKTGRGDYLLKLAAPPELSGDALILPLVMEHRAGLERVGLICRVALQKADAPKSHCSFGELLEPDSQADRELLKRIAAGFEREFEQVREAALRSIRAERKPLQINVEGFNPAAFTF
jgi:predicted YcjX-like family ATPase